MKKFNIPASRVVRHSDVSGDHVRGKGKGKTDPGSAFDWKAFQKSFSCVIEILLLYYDYV